MSREQRRYRTALITGGLGFIGTALRPVLLKAVDEIVIFDNLLAQVHGEKPQPSPLGPRERFIRGDVRDASHLSAVVEETNPDLVVHLAAETGTGQSYDEVPRYCEVNVTGTANLVQALRRLSPHQRRVVLTSSRAVYGEGQYRDAAGNTVVPPPRTTAAMSAGLFTPLDPTGIVMTPLPTVESAPPAPASVYASTKLMQEYVLSQALDATPIELVTLRLQNVYGAGQSVNNPYTGVLTIFSKLVADGHGLDVYEDGLITRDFVHVKDVAHAIVAAALVEKVVEGPVNIGSGVASTILDVAHAVLAFHGFPKSKAEVSGRFRSGDVRHAVAEINYARSVLDWQPRVAFGDGLADLIRWVEARAV